MDDIGREAQALLSACYAELAAQVDTASALAGAGPPRSGNAQPERGGISRIADSSDGATAMSVSAEPMTGGDRRRPLSPFVWFLLGLFVARRRAVEPEPRTTDKPRLGGSPSDDKADTPAEARDLAAAERDRGRTAEAPTQIPARGWKDVLWRTWTEIGEDDVMTVARSIAFSGMLALFPALAAFVSVYGLFADVDSAREHLAALTGIVPAEVMTLLGEQMVRIAAQKDASLGFTFILGLLLSIWSANAGVKALFKGLNIAYEEKEKRNFIRLNLVTLAFTVGTIAFLTLAIASMVVVPVALKALGLGGGAAILAFLRWPALLAVAALGLSAIYRYGPSRDAPKWRWVSWGSGLAALMWLVGSALFSWYLANFANYNETYGSLGAVFGFMMWLWLSGVIVLFGAELNSEMEHQTAADTTTGQPQPLGVRGAKMADTVGPAMKGSRPPKTGRPPEG
jgi:membrane protein